MGVNSIVKEKVVKDEKKKKASNVGVGLKKHIEKMKTNPEYRQLMVEKYKKIDQMQLKLICLIKIR